MAYSRREIGKLALGVWPILGTRSALAGVADVDVKAHPFILARPHGRDLVSRSISTVPR